MLVKIHAWGLRLSVLGPSPDPLPGLCFWIPLVDWDFRPQDSFASHHLTWNSEYAPELGASFSTPAFSVNPVIPWRTHIVSAYRGVSLILSATDQRAPITYSYYDQWRREGICRPGQTSVLPPPHPVAYLEIWKGTFQVYIFRSFQILAYFSQ